MKKITLTVAAILTLAATAALAAPGDEWLTTRWSAAIAADTNATAVTSSVPYDDAEVKGWADTFILNLSGAASPTCTVKVVTLASPETGAARTILTLATATASGSYPLRDLVTTQAGVDIANTPARVPLFSQLRLQVYAGNKTGIVARAYLIATDRP